jgi:hypothetical protein
LLQTTGRAAANGQIAKVAATHIAVAAEADGKVLGTVGASMAITKALTLGAAGSKAVATKAAVLGKPFVAVPASIVSHKKTKAALASAKIGMAKSALALKEAAIVKAVSAAIAAKRIAKIQAHYKATEMLAVGKLAKSGFKAAATGAKAIESLVLFPKGLAPGELLGNEAIPFLLDGVLGGAASSDVFEMIGRFSPGAATLLGGLLSAVRPDGGRAQELLIAEDEESAIDPFYDSHSSAVAPDMLDNQNSAVAPPNVETDLDTTALLMNVLRGVNGANGMLEVEVNSDMPPMFPESQNSAIDPIEEVDTSDVESLNGGKPLGLLGNLLQLLPVPEDLEGMDFGAGLTGLLPIVVNGLGALMGGAEPGTAGLPKHLSANLIDNLAHLVPDFF